MTRDFVASPGGSTLVRVYVASPGGCTLIRVCVASPSGSTLIAISSLARAGPEPIVEWTGPAAAQAAAAVLEPGQLLASWR